MAEESMATFQDWLKPFGPRRHVGDNLQQPFQMDQNHRNATPAVDQLYTKYEPSS
jgi:hypothetical protein